MSQKDRHSLGPSKAPVTLVVYSDFECPYCSKAAEICFRLKQEFGDQLRLVFRHFPLRDIHPSAELAAQAAEAAAAQGVFWEMHDLLFANQKNLSPEVVVQLAIECDLDLEQFGEELEKGQHWDAVEADLRLGKKEGVEGIPSFFVNGTLFEGSADERSLREFIEEKIGSHKATRRSA